MFIDDLIEKLTAVRAQKGNVRVVKEFGDSPVFAEADYVDVEVMDVIGTTSSSEATIFYPTSHRVAGANGKETVVKLD